MVGPDIDMFDILLSYPKDTASDPSLRIQHLLMPPPSLCPQLGPPLGLFNNTLKCKLFSIRLLGDFSYETQSFLVKSTGSCVVPPWLVGLVGLGVVSSPPSSNMIHSFSPTAVHLLVVVSCVYPLDRASTYQNVRQFFSGGYDNPARNT